MIKSEMGYEESHNPLILVCGPPSFTSLVLKYLTLLGFDEDMFHAFT